MPTKKQTAAEVKAKANRIRIRHEQAAVRASLKADATAQREKEEHEQTVADAKAIEDAATELAEREAAAAFLSTDLSEVVEEPKAVDWSRPADAPRRMKSAKESPTWVWAVVAIIAAGIVLLIFRH